MRGDLAAGDARLPAHRDGGSNDNRQPPGTISDCCRHRGKNGLILLDQIRTIDKSRLG